MNKKQILSLVVLVVLLASSSAFITRANASDESDKNEKTNSVVEKTNSESLDNQNEGENEFEQEDDKIKQDEHGEDDLNHNFDELLNTVSSTAVVLPELSSDGLKTYGDAIAVLNVYQKDLEQLSAQANVGGALGTTLTDQEKTLLQSLLKKHNKSFVQLNARVKEINDQIQGVIELLQPMAQNEVSPMLKKLVVGVVHNFKDEIDGLKDLEHQNIDVLDFETTI